MLYTSRLCSLRPDLVPFCVYVRHYAAHHGRVGWPRTHTTRRLACVSTYCASMRHVHPCASTLPIDGRVGWPGAQRHRSMPREGLKFDLMLPLECWQVRGAHRRPLHCNFWFHWPAYAHRTVPHQPIQEPRLLNSILRYRMWHASPTSTIFSDVLVD